MNRFAIMQGRLTAPENNAIQAFPRAAWRDEFPRATTSGLDAIEWIHDAYGADANPILTPEGHSEMRALIEEHGIAVRSLCADWFMDFPFVRCTEDERRIRIAHLEELLGMVGGVGVSRMVLPFVDNSSLKSAEERETARDILEHAAPHARAAGIELHLETDFGPQDFADFLDGLPEDIVKVNFDSGNSSGLGYPPAEEFAAWGQRLGSVHIKDRILGGTTMPLGEGSCNFPAVFAELKALNYDGDIVLQVARGTDGGEVELARHNRAFVEAGLAAAG